MLPISPKGHKYGFQPSLKDHRRRYFIPRIAAANIPDQVLPLTKNIAAYDQGQLGSCTAHGWARLVQDALQRELAPLAMPSRLAIYYGERVIENDIGDDAGAEVHDGADVVLFSGGILPESEWPYDTSKFAQKPPDFNPATAIILNGAYEKQTVPCNLENIQQTLASGQPIVGGFTVFDSFESDAVANTGVMPIPKDNENVLGGHCVVWTGYDKPSGVFYCANSWGIDWGMNPFDFGTMGCRGWFTMPFECLNIMSDLVTLVKVA